MHTLSAMTAGIRRNWIQAVMKNVRPSTAPDVARSVRSLPHYTASDLNETWMSTGGTSFMAPSLVCHIFKQFVIQSSLDDFY